MWRELYAPVSKMALHVSFAALCLFLYSFLALINDAAGFDEGSDCIGALGSARGVTWHVLGCEETVEGSCFGRS